MGDLLSGEQDLLGDLGHYQMIANQMADGYGLRPIRHLELSHQILQAPAVNVLLKNQTDWTPQKQVSAIVQLT